MHFACLRQRELARIEELGDKAFADLPNLFVKGSVDTEAGTG